MTTSCTQLLILGCGGNSIDVIDLVGEINAAAGAPNYNCMGFLDDNPKLAGTHVASLPVLGPLSAVQDYPEAQLVYMVGSPNTYLKREAILAALKVQESRFPALVSPLAAVSLSARIEDGCVLFPHVTVGNGVLIGKYSMVLPGTVISHDATVGQYSCVGANVTICGGVTIGNSCYVGAASAIREYVCVGEGALVGMSACVLNDVPSGARVVGNPARPI